jgi:outer membrane protein
MRINWFGFVTAAAIMLFGMGSASGQTIKIGYTDAQLIVSQMDDYHDVMSKLQGMADSSQTEYQNLVKSYQDKLADYQKKQALLSETAKSSREQELTTLQEKIQQFLSDKDQELQKHEQELMNPLLERVQNAINEVAAEKGLTLVFNAQASGSPVLLFADSSMDVTEFVMDKLGIPKQAPPPQNK